MFKYNYVSFITLLLVTVCLVCFGFCSGSHSLAKTYHSNSVYVSDTMLYKEHSYIIVREKFNSFFQVLHSPDCQCRFNRKFIVVKHESKR